MRMAQQARRATLAIRGRRALKDVVIKEVRPLPVLLLVDNSGSMANEKINTVNVALKEMLAEFSSIKMQREKFI